MSPLTDESLQLRIGQLASLTGVTTKTIRHYHKVGLLPKPQRGKNNYRSYGINDLYRLKMVLRLKEVGLSLDEIREVIYSENPDVSLQGKLHILEENLYKQIARLEEQRNHVRELLAEEISLKEFDKPGNESQTHQFLLKTLTEYAARTPEGIQSLDEAFLARLDSFQWGDEYRAYWENLSKALSGHFEPFQRANELFASAADMDISDSRLETIADEIASQLGAIQSMLTLPKLERPMQEAFIRVAVRSMNEVLTLTQKYLVDLIRDRLPSKSLISN